MENTTKSRYQRQPSRRIEGQRRSGRVDRRSQNIHVVHCKRLTGIDRRCPVERRHLPKQEIQPLEQIPESRLRQKFKLNFGDSFPPPPGSLIDLAI